MLLKQFRSFYWNHETDLCCSNTSTRVYMYINFLFTCYTMPRCLFLFLFLCQRQVKDVIHIYISNSVHIATVMHVYARVLFVYLHACYFIQCLRMLSTPQYCSLCFLTALVTSTTVFGWCVQYLRVSLCAEAGDILCYREFTVTTRCCYTLPRLIN